MTGSQQYKSFVGGYYCYTLLIILLPCHAGLQRCNAAVHSSNTSAASSLDSNIKAISSALLEFKAGITSDPASLLASWIDGSNPCDQSRPWQGVACDAEGRNLSGLRLAAGNLSGAMISAPALATLCAGGHLSVLNLYNNSLSGSLPPSLGACSSLRKLDLRHNLLSGPLPSPAFSNLSSLYFLGLSYNTFSGPVPRHIWHLPALRTLYVSCPAGCQNPPMQASDLPEVLPFCATLLHLSLFAVSFSSNTANHLMTSISQCKRLQYLYLGETSLAGTIPEDFWQLPSLTTLGLNSLGDQLAPASLPQHLPSCGTIQIIDFEGVKMNGQIPPSIGNCSGLQELILQNAGGLTGTLPETLGKLANLEYVDLWGNDVAGPVPSELANCSKLQHLDLGSNHISSGVPQSFANLHNLQSLDWSGNPLPGGVVPEFVMANLSALVQLRFQLCDVAQFPLRLGRLSQLQSLDLGINRYEGPISNLMELGRLSQLTYLNLGTNELAGSQLLEELIHALSNCTQLAQLYLDHNHFSGSLPHNIGHMQSLQVFYINDNMLSGSIPASIGNSNLINDLNMGNNRLEGQIPSSLGRLVGLNKNLILSNNTLTGSISEELGNLSQLKVLDLSRNNLSGHVPRAALLNCTSLEILRLHENSLTGPLDKMELWKMSRLTTFTAQQNQLYGKITSNLTNSSSLVLVNLGNNHLSGALPSEKVSQGLEKLRVLILSNNKFSGGIPNWIWELPNLQVLDLSNSSFVGAMPTSMAHLEYFKRIGSQPINESMTLYEEVPLPNDNSPQIMSYLINARIVLDISHNSIHGSIPSNIGELVGLTWLDLSNNLLTGHIPPSFGSITYLDNLDLSSNSLQGTIPSELGFLTFLGRLNLSNNDLVGPIPVTNDFNTRFGPSSFQGNVGLCGSPLSNLCNTTNTNTTDNTTNLDNTMSSSWFADNFSIGGIILGYILGLFGFLGCLWLRKRATKLMRGKYLHASQHTGSLGPQSFT